MISRITTCLSISGLLLAAFAGSGQHGVHAVAITNFTVTMTPDINNINIPEIPQTTSHDPVVQCDPYYAPQFAINPAEWPTPWELATSNGMEQSQEFMTLYNSIDWTTAPAIPVRAKTPEGGIDMDDYDEGNDPDCWWSATKCTQPKHANILADIIQCPEPQTWGLSFDDGPNCSHNAFYDYLSEQNQKASMFYTGTNVLSWPYGALRGMRDQHHIAAHSWAHQPMTTLTNVEVLAELYYAAKVIRYVTGVTPLYWRPPQGDIDDRVRWIASQLNFTAILWTLDTNDWAAADPLVTHITPEQVKQNYQEFISMGQNGTFANHGNGVLSHENSNITMQIFMEEYPAIKAAYTNVQDMATCLRLTQPYIESVPALSSPPPPPPPALIARAIPETDEFSSSAAGVLPTRLADLSFSLIAVLLLVVVVVF